MEEELKEIARKQFLYNAYREYIAKKEHPSVTRGKNYLIKWLERNNVHM